MTIPLPTVCAVLVALVLAGAHTAGAQQPRGEAPFNPPDESTIPDGPMGDAIRYGKQILTDPRTHLQGGVASHLRCVSCHLDNGRTPHAAPWVGIWGVFPEYRSRNAQVNVLQDRVNDCIERSINGKRQPVESPQMRAIMAYMQWLSQGVPTGIDVQGRGFKRITSPQPASAERGKEVYAAKCASCHGSDGQGMYDAAGAVVYPSLWGPYSFTIGAGMGRIGNASAFVKWNMPFGQGGTLTDQEAMDVAAYFTVQPRPDFARKHLDWPKGDKPKDARY